MRSKWLRFVPASSLALLSAILIPLGSMNQRPTITEPLVACPNDPDDIKPLSAVQNAKIDEVFIGSCMTNIGHFRAAAKVLGQ